MRRYRRSSGLKRMLVVMCILLGIVIGIYIVVERNIFPVIVTMAEARVQTQAVRAMNDAVKETMQDPEIYTKLVQVVTAKDGTIAMVQSNTALINDLSTRINNNAQDKLMDMGEQGVRVPFGSVLGSQLLSGRGPNITVRIIPIGTVQSTFRTEFENAGINQTRHKIIMSATATVRLVMPGNNSRTVHVTADIPISESIIIGKVPNSYVNVGDSDELTYPQTFLE